jgi:hypothetical protein
MKEIISSSSANIADYQSLSDSLFKLKERMVECTQEGKCLATQKKILANKIEIARGDIKNMIEQNVPQEILEAIRNGDDVCEIQRDKLIDFWGRIIDLINTGESEEAERFFMSSKYNPYKDGNLTDIEEILISSFFPSLQPSGECRDLSLTVCNTFSPNGLLFLDSPLHYRPLSAAKPLRILNEDDSIFLETSPITGDYPKEAQRINISKGKISAIRLVLSYIGDHIDSILYYHGLGMNLDRIEKLIEKNNIDRVRLEEQLTTQGIQLQVAVDQLKDIKQQIAVALSSISIEQA